MTNNNLGLAYEAAIHARRHLGVVHVALGLIASFSLWTGSSIPHFNAFSRGAGWFVIILSVLGWGPYLISWRYNRSILDRNSGGVIAFSVGAVIVTALGAGLYQHVFAVQNQPPKFLISAGVALSLIALGKLCSMIWRPASNRNEQ
jgi:hypothetical protein